MSTDFRDLARMRLQEAEALLDVGHWSGAYYLAGYSIECALKAAIFRDMQRYSVPNKDLVTRSYTHSLVKLAELAGLSRDLDGELSQGTQVGVNWLLVKDWNEESRYAIWSEADATDMINAIRDSQSGVLQWVQSHW